MTIDPNGWAAEYWRTELAGARDEIRRLRAEVSTLRVALLDTPLWEQQANHMQDERDRAYMELREERARHDDARAALTRVEALCYGYPTGVPPVLIRAALRGDE